MKYWNQIAWTVFWSFLCVLVAVPTVGTAFNPFTTWPATLIGLALALMLGFLACRAFDRRTRGRA